MYMQVSLRMEVARLVKTQFQVSNCQPIFMKQLNSTTELEK